MEQHYFGQGPRATFRTEGGVMVTLHRRLMQLAASRKLSVVEVDRNIVNTERQSSRFKIDSKTDLEEMGYWPVTPVSSSVSSMFRIGCTAKKKTLRGT